MKIGTGLVIENYVSISTTQVRIVEADNTAQYWPNLGSQRSVIIIGPVSPFASVNYWADDGGLCRLFKFTDLHPKLGPVSALYQADCHFCYGIQFRNKNSQSTAHPVWNNFMALASARPDYLLSSSGADYKAWSGTGQNCNVFVRSEASQPLIRGWLATNWWSINKVLVEETF